MGATRLMAACALAWALVSISSAQEMRIQFAEPVSIAATAGNTQFDAFGRRFALTLEANDRLLKGMPAARKAALATTRILRGSINGLPGSWVRLTVSGTNTAGAIWDGTDLYILARYGDVAHYLTSPLNVGAQQSVVYRMSDTLNVLPRNFCASQPASPADAGPSSGLAQFKGLVRELKLQFVAAPTDQLDISLIADTTLQQVYSSPSDDLAAAMLNTLNIVDGIYDGQLGLVINAADLRLVPAGADPFTSDDSHVLLGQLSTYRGSIPEVRSKPIAHLLTARVLDGGSTLGVAMIEGACDADDGVSLTTNGFGALTPTTALVMAHEIGHNLGAHHDTSACGNTFLMWPEYTFITTPVFSQCSLDEIRPFIAARRGSCFTSPMYGDAEARIGPIPHPVATEPFVWPVFVRSAGTAPLANARVGLNIQGVTINSAVPTSGSCAPLNGDMVCNLGTLVAGTEARVDLNLTSNYPQDLRLQAFANGDNDRYENNNLVYATTTVEPQARLAVSVNPTTRSALVGETVSYTYTLVSSGVHAARNVSISLGGSSFWNTAATTTRGTCFVSFNSANCNIGDIPSGSSVQVVLEGHATQGVSMNIGANVTTANAFMSDSHAFATLNATATRDLAIDVSTAIRVAVVGSPYELTFPIRANGTQAISDGRFRMNAGGITVQSVTIDGVPCAATDYLAALGGGCPLGNMNAGDERTVVLRLLFDGPAYTNIVVMADTSLDELWSNNQAALLFIALSGTDVAVSARIVDAQTEGQTLHVSADISSLGANDAANVTATLDVPAGLRILSATLPQGTCTVSSPRRITCTRGTLASNGSVLMSADVVGDAPALYTGTFTVGALDDGVSTNNTANSIINVRSSADVWLNAVPAFPALVVGRPVDVFFEAVSGPTRPAHNVRITIPATAGIVIDSLSAPAGTCTITASSGVCNLGDLAANAVVRVNARYSAVGGLAGLAGWVRVDADDDFNHGNDLQSIRIDTYPSGDAEVRVASGSATGTVGNTVVLPRITVNTLSRIDGLAVEIPLPGFVSVDQVSLARGICSGTTLLRCELGSRDAGETDTIDITLKLNAAGAFTSSLLVKAINDTNAGNDTGSLQIQANAVTSPGGGGGASSGGGGGGGGRIEWALLAALAFTAARRVHAGHRWRVTVSS